MGKISVSSLEGPECWHKTVLLCKNEEKQLFFSPGKCFRAQVPVWDVMSISLSWSKGVQDTWRVSSWRYWLITHNRLQTGTCAQWTKPLLLHEAYHFPTSLTLVWLRRELGTRDFNIYRYPCTAKSNSGYFLVKGNRKSRLPAVLTRRNRWSQ